MWAFQYRAPHFARLGVASVARWGYTMGRNLGGASVRVNLALNGVAVSGWLRAAALPVLADLTRPATVESGVLALFAAAGAGLPWERAGATLYWLGGAVLLCRGEEPPDTRGKIAEDGYTCFARGTGEALYWEWANAGVADVAQLIAALEVL